MNDMNRDMMLTKENTPPGCWLISTQRFKKLVSKLPDDGEIRIEVEKKYSDKERFDLEKVDGFKLIGKTFIIACTTNV